MNSYNILYIHSHDTGRFVQPYGYAVHTPHIQRLAEEGILFRDCHAVAPTCSPSRAGLLTGQCAHRSGMLGLAHRGFSLTDYRHHIIHTLAQNGYTSVLAGVQHIASKAETIGYHHILPRGDDHQVACSVRDYLLGKPEEPFFLSVGFSHTHRPFRRREDKPADGRYVSVPAPLPDHPLVRQDIADLAESVQRLDSYMGIVFDALESSGLKENTIVVCTTDHGIPFPWMKCNLTAWGTGVMLILRIPGFAGGIVVDALVSHLDVYPTICELTGCEKPPWLEGYSLLPLIRGERSEIRSEVYTEVNYHASFEPQRAVRTKEWSYIRRFQTEPTVILPNIDDGLTKTFLLERGLEEHLVEEEALFNLVYDPTERNNLADKPEMAPILADLRKRLHDWMVATEDPLLTGSVVPDSGVIVNPTLQVSPEEEPELLYEVTYSLRKSID